MICHPPCTHLAVSGARWFKEKQTEQAEALDFVRRLLDAPGVVVAAVTLEVAGGCALRLRERGIEVRMAPAAVTATAAGEQRRPAVWIAATAAAVAVVAVLLLLVRGRDGAPADGGSATTRELAAAAARASVQLRCGEQLGAGFFVLPDVVVTNAHVLCAKGDVEVLLDDGRVLAGTRTAADDWLDVALVQVRGAAAQPLPLGDATALAQGDRVVLMGSPHGLGFTLSEGMISHPARNVMGVSYLQVDASVNPGNSGGPLLDMGGHAVGIVSMQVEGTGNLGLALPVNYLVDGPASVLPGLALEYDTDRWRARLEAAAEGERKELAELRGQRQAASLAGAAVVRPGALVAVVVRWAESEPPSEQLSFSLAMSEGGEPVCSPNGTVASWRPVPEGGRERHRSRYVRWLERSGLQGELYSGEVHLRMPGCPGPSRLVGAQLTLQGAAAGGERVSVEGGS
jgi:S1-C subfamily serine protease